MRPITLKISAFGPYAGETELNFEELGAQRLFVITGPTGSGKTTIFEAILYALYGTLSKKGMDAGSLRCDFLKPGDERLTYIDFLFEVGGKQYQIHRQPKQFVAKKRGSGMREISQEAVLQCVGHEAFLPLAKVGEVDEKIVELIGLDAEQFQKIVMLPQGAFQEFLVSTTKDKMELLRHIFDTTIYDLALAHIKNHVSALQGDYKETKIRYQSQLQLLRFDEPFALEEEPSENILTQIRQHIEKDDEKGVRLETDISRANHDYANAVATRDREKAHNDDVAKWQKCGRMLNQLMQQKPETEQWKMRITNAEKAQGLLSDEMRVIQEKQMLDAQRSKEKQAEENLKQAKAACVVAHKQLQNALDEKKQAESAHATLPQKMIELEKKKQYLAEKRFLTEAEENLQKATVTLQKKQTESTQEKTRINDMETALAEKNRLLAQRAEEKVAEVQCTQTLHTQREWYRKVDAAIKLVNAREEAARTCERTEQALQEVQARLHDVQMQNKKHLAQKLAADLEEGEPCPVCGARSHPAPALGETHSIDEEAVIAQNDRAKEAALKAKMVLKQIDEQRAEIFAELADIEPLVRDEESVKQFEEKLRKQGIEGKKRLSALKASIAAKDTAIQSIIIDENDLADAKEAYRVLQDACMQFVAQQSEWQATVQSKTKTLQALEEALGGGVEATAVVQLEKQIKEIDAHYQRARSLCDQAQRDYTTLQLAQTKAESEWQQQTARVKEAAKHAEGVEAFFLHGRNALFQDATDYEKAKHDISQKQVLQKKIDAFHTKLTEVTTTERLLSERLGEDRAFHDLSVSEQVLEQAKQALKNANDAYASFKTRMQENKKHLQEIESLLAQFKGLEKQYAMLGKLRDVLDGKNKFNMRLETFAQAYYFERMLAMANTRLARMTHGRYSFRRRETVRNNRRQAGLDLDVMDEYTGRARDVSTLSGGESFKASLSLALGLADVVSNESGGVELSTIFIDEGFGTLDEESLDDTVETLVGLQDSGRLVGVISHVAELKERIPAHLVVEAGYDGSHAHFEVRQ